MRILDKYIIRRVANAYFLILFLFVGLYVIVDVFSSLPHILETKPPAAILGAYYLNSLPLILLRVSPFALLISTLYAFGELNKYNEIISLRSSGLNIVRIALPVIVLSLIVSTALLFLQEKVLIYSQKRVEDIKSEYIKKKIDSGQEEKLAFSSGDYIVFAHSYSPQEKILRNVIIFQEDARRNIVKKIVCNEIVYEYGFWIGKEIVEYDLDEQGKISSSPVAISHKKIPLKDKPNELVMKKSFLSQFASLQSLRKRINSLKKIGVSKQLSDLIVDYHRKIVEPFNSFFLVMGVLPLALEIKKKKATRVPTSSNPFGTSIPP